MAQEHRRKPTQARAAERIYSAQLRRLADQVGRIITMSAKDDDIFNARTNNALDHLMRQYAITLEPWARTIATKMVNSVNHRDLASWREMGVEISAGLRREVMTAPQDSILNALIDVQVELIKSIPIEAAERVNKLAFEAQFQGKRASTIVAEIMNSGGVARSRAMTIARTEVSRTASVLTQSRAQAIGSKGYIWRTSKDGDVRPSHKKMQGQFVSWDNPPTLDNLTGHAGCLPNCRCWPEVVFYDDERK